MVIRVILLNLTQVAALFDEELRSICRLVRMLLNLLSVSKLSRELRDSLFLIRGIVKGISVVKKGVMSSGNSVTSRN